MRRPDEGEVVQLVDARPARREVAVAECSASSFGNMNKEIAFRFAQASAAGTARGLVDVRTDSPTGDVVATCTLAATGGANTYTTQPCAFTSPVSGSRRLYLMFRQAPGGPTTNFGNLNWVQFSGAGIGS